MPTACDQRTPDFGKITYERAISFDTERRLVSQCHVNRVNIPNLEVVLVRITPVPERPIQLAFRRCH